MIPKRSRKARGCVFLDEIGDLEAAIQVKLLRVIESRTFQPVGETRSRQFKGKLLAATNRHLPAAIEKGDFREDLYFRLCSDQIPMPSLADQLREEPELLDELAAYVARRVAGQASSSLTRRAAAWIRSELGEDYPWQGNFRELGQCVRNILIRGRYTPLQKARLSPRNASSSANSAPTNSCATTARWPTVTLEVICKPAAGSISTAAPSKPRWTWTCSAKWTAELAPDAFSGGPKPSDIESIRCG
ncbi:MAG TPA: sigma 54-interacting transcriptional regulator [Acidobacteriota bacterium]|nr:sigma 54-interacting transcriptional regulator [Acidobacteriota bacterium]